MTSNGVDPDHMTADERLGETARILAVGLLRFRAKRAGEKPLKTERVSLDIPSVKRLYGPKPQPNGEGS